jgi:predicted ATPase/class 3 adenylate cyclase
MNTELPSGLLTFLFTDIEASTARWESFPDEMRAAMQLHDSLLYRCVEERGGSVFKGTGDGIGAVFVSPQRAADAAVAIQRGLQECDWGDSEPLRVRIGLNIGEAEPHRDDYFGPPVNRAARVMDVANGGQIAMARNVVDFVSGYEIEAVGAHQLRGIGTEHLSLLRSTDIDDDDRPLRSRVGVARAVLPTPAQRIIGRDDDLHAITALLRDHRAVTLVGPGGIGKTRLAIEAGLQLGDEFSEGIVMCDLAQVDDDEAVADAIAEAVGARLQPGLDLEESIVQFLEHRSLLLFVDGCEHVLSTARRIVQSALAVDGPAVLSTSRERLAVDGEYVFDVAPLSPDSSAAELFMERAAARDARFAIGPGDKALIEEICGKVDGLPLGIELAAAWVRVLSLEQLNEQLEDRFRLLTGTQWGGRQETLRDTIRWSYEQLDDDQAALFLRLSVFAGGFSLEAVEAVCGDELVSRLDLLDLIMALVDKSMVVTQRGAGHIRFRMLSSLRQFGQEQLGGGEGDASLRARHCDYFTQLAITQAEMLLTDKEPEVWDLLGQDWANIRGALDHLVDTGDIDGAVDVALAVAWFSAFAMRFEGYAWAEELWPKISEDHPRAGSLLGMRAMGAYLTANPASMSLATQGLQLDPKDPTGLCRASMAAHYLNNVHSAEDSGALTEEWLTTLDGGDDANRLWAEGFRVFHLATHDPRPEALERATALFDRACVTGSATTMAIARWAQGLGTAVTDRDRAMALWDDGVDVARSLNSRHLAVHLLTGLQIHFSAGRDDLPVALERCRSTLETSIDHHYMAGTSHLFGVTAIVLARADRADVGAQLLGAMRANGHIPRGNAMKALSQAVDGDLDDALAAGAGLSINAAATIAVASLTEAIDAQAAETAQTT